MVDIGSIVYPEFLLRGQTLELLSTCICKISCVRNIKHQRTGKRFGSHRKIIRPHTTKMLMNANIALEWFLPRLPYSPDIFPCYYHLFPELDHHKRTKRFCDVEEFKTEMVYFVLLQKTEHFIATVYLSLHHTGRQLSNIMVLTSLNKFHGPMNGPFFHTNTASTILMSHSNKVFLVT